MTTLATDQEETGKVDEGKAANLLEHTSATLPRLLKEIGEGASLLSQPVLLELNSWLTVHGTLGIDRDGSIRFEPGLDARLLGQHMRRTAVEKLRGVRRIDGGRRVVFMLDDEEWVLRGVAAQQAWVIVRAMQETQAERGERTGEQAGERTGEQAGERTGEQAGERTGEQAGQPAPGYRVQPIFLPVTLHGRTNIEGVLAIGLLGMGFGARMDRLFVLASSTVWISVLEIHGLRLEYPGIHMKTAEASFAFGCDGSVAIRDLLVSRWFQLANSEVKERKDCTWSRSTVRKEGLSVQMGRLAILNEGLCFVPMGGPVELLIPRRREGVLEMIESTRGGVGWLLLVGADASSVGEWVVQNPLGCIQELEEHLVDPAWFPPDNQTNNPLMEEVIGPASYVNLWRGHQKLAGRERVPFAPFGGKLRLKLDGVAEPPPLPFAVRLEVANAHGRFLLTGILREWQPVDPKRNRRAPPTERQILVSLEREIIPDNRRQFYRLPLKERLPLVLISAVPSARNPDPSPDLIEGAVLMDLSRKGASLWFSACISDDVRVSFELTVETHPEAPPRDGHEAMLQAGEGSEESVENAEQIFEEITIESFHLRGAITYGIPWKIGKELGWRIGMRFDDNVDGFGAFDVRQRAFLRQRAEGREERDARGVWG